LKIFSLYIQSNAAHLADKPKNLRNPTIYIISDPDKKSLRWCYSPTKYKVIDLLVTTPTRAKGHKKKEQNPQNAFIQLIRDADKKGRHTAEIDYAGFKDFQFIPRPS